MEIKIKKINFNARLPRKATEQSIGYDLYIPEDVMIMGRRQVIPIGLSLEMPEGIEAKIEARSGYSAKGIEGYQIVSDKSITDAVYMRIDKAERFNADVLTGKIDPDYRGEVGIIIRNNEPNNKFLIKGGTRLAQMTFYKTEDAMFREVEMLTETERADGGYGHSDKVK